MNNISVKKSHKSFIIALSVIVAVSMLLTGCTLSTNPSDESHISVNDAAFKGEGLGNLNSRGAATVNGDVIYYKHPIDYQLHTLNLKTNEASLLGKDSFCTINANDSVFYLSFYYDSETQDSGFNMYKLAEEGEDILLFSDIEITYPQVSGDYIYYLKSVPEFNSGYSSYIYRAKLTESSTPELVCDVLCSSFYVDADTLFFCDVSNTSLMTVSIEDAVNVAKTNPLEQGIQRHSGEIGASVFLPETLAVNMIIKDKILYFIDYLNQGEFCRYDFKTNEITGFNNGIFINNYNIAGDYIYYHNQSDYCIYRMKTDGTEVQKVSSICDGQIILSNGYLIYVGISTNEATYGDRYISVCDSEGSVIKDITFTEDYDPYRDTEGAEEYYDDYAYSEEESTESTSDAE